MSLPRVLYGYSYYPSEAYRDVEQWDLAYIQRLRDAGFDVKGFCLTINPPGPRLSFRELDQRWKRGDKDLLAMYERLERQLASRDILINASGINLHPELDQELPAITVFLCF